MNTKNYLLFLISIVAFNVNLLAQWDSKSNPIYTENAKVGIGLSSPTASLHINNDDTNSALTINHDNTTKIGVNFSTLGYGLLISSTRASNRVDPYLFSTRDAAGNTLFQVRKSGKIGIGTTAPKETLQIGNQFTFHDGGEKNIANNSYYDTEDKTSKRLVQGNSSKVALAENGDVYFAHSNSDAGNTAITWTKSLYLKSNGNVGIGQYDFNKADFNDDYKLTVAGKARVEELNVRGIQWWDAVFKDDYQLMDIEEKESFTTKNYHLPSIPSEEAIDENGVNLANTLASAVKELEEAYLYIFELKKQLEQQKAEIEMIKAELQKK